MPTAGRTGKWGIGTPTLASLFPILFFLLPASCPLFGHGQKRDGQHGDQGKEHEHGKAQAAQRDIDTKDISDNLHLASKGHSAYLLNISGRSGS